MAEGVGPAGDQVAGGTRDRIVDAAMEAFAERGVEATSLDSVARTVGVRKQTLLYWFPSKEQLLFGVIDHAVAHLGLHLTAAALDSHRRQHRRSVSATGSGPGAPPPQRPTAAEPRDLSVPPPAIGPQRSASPVDVHSRLVAVVDATFRLGAAEPDLLAVVREVARLGPPASVRLATAVEPLVAGAVAALAAQPADATDANQIGRLDLRSSGHRNHVRAALLAAGARVLGMVTEADVRADLGLPVDLAWLRSRRRDLLEFLTQELALDSRRVRDL